VRTIFAWFDGYRPGKPEVGLVLHSGQRILLTDHSAVEVAAIIRRDQPWVERTAPKIGDHEEDYAPRVTQQEAPVSESAVVPAAPAKSVTIQAVSHLAIRVSDLPRAEAFYSDMFALEVVAREKLGASGYEPTADAGSADISFLRNGPLVVALHANPAGARLERSLLDHISLELDATSYHRVKGAALMRGYEFTANADTAAAFRDPFGIVWEIAVAGNPAFHATA
jgi:catechol 2,3-dioxygenase-like lactoylglutathione lyase family enzyme